MEGFGMAEADLDVVIRRIAKEQLKGLMDAARKRRDQFLALAAKAKDKAASARHRQVAKDTMLQGAAIAKRLQISAENAADSYVRSMKKAAEQKPIAEKPKAEKRKAEKAKPTAGRKKKSA